jgi:hypothetical protein
VPVQEKKYILDNVLSIIRPDSKREYVAKKGIPEFFEKSCNYILSLPRLGGLQIGGPFINRGRHREAHPSPMGPIIRSVSRRSHVWPLVQITKEALSGSNANIVKENLNRTLTKGIYRYDFLSKGCPNCSFGPDSPARTATEIDIEESDAVVFPNLNMTQEF